MRLVSKLIGMQPPVSSPLPPTPVNISLEQLMGSGAYF